MGKILIKNGKVWDGEQFLYADILTDNGHIHSIAPDIKESADYIYDADGKVVSTGLVDIHTHMFGYWGINAEMSCIPFGVTAAADASAEPDRKEQYSNSLIKNKVFLRADFKDNKAQLDNTIKLLEYYGEKAAGIKVYFDTNSSDVRDTNPLKEVCDYAKRNDLIVMVHTTGSPVSMSEISETLNKGDIITHAYHGGGNNASLDNFECLSKAKEKGIIIDAGFAGNVHTDFAVFESAIKNGNLPDTISTDITKFSAYKRGGRYGMTMCMNIAKALGMNEENIFRAVTCAPAKALHKENEWGYLRVGRRADLAVFDYTDEGFDLTDAAKNHIESKYGYRCILTISDGEVVYRL